jgi:hypothetical protein
LADSVDFIMDTSKLDNILNTTKLLGALYYPIAVAAALLIGGFLCACGLAVYNGAGMAAASAELVPFAVLYFAATRKNILELLQTRE